MPALQALEFYGQRRCLSTHVDLPDGRVFVANIFSSGGQVSAAYGFRPSLDRPANWVACPDRYPSMAAAKRGLSKIFASLQ